MARRRQGFVRNYKGVGAIMRGAGVKKFVHDVAEKGADKAGVHVVDYVTDRGVSSLLVKGEDQAKDGKLTKAVGELGWDIR